MPLSSRFNNNNNTNNNNDNENNKKRKAKTEKRQYTKKNQAKPEEDDDNSTAASATTITTTTTTAATAATANTNGNQQMDVDDKEMTETTKNEPKAQIAVQVKPGYVLSVGENLSNQLGLGSEINDRKKPQVVKTLPNNVQQVVAGGMHSAVLTADGIVYTFGCNDEFALGRNEDEEVDKVDLPEKIIQISAGDSHTAALGESGCVYAWGTFRDGNGVLGLEEKQIAKTPFKFKIDEKVTKISSGADHLVFLTEGGEVYTAGNSEHGQLGRVSKYNSYRGGRRGCDMILVPGLVRIAKKRELNRNQLFDDIHTTAYCTFLRLKDTNTFIGFGLNNSHQLGLEDIENRYQPEILNSLKFDSKIQKIVGGMHHTLFLDNTGHVYSCGSHRYGSLGIGKIENFCSKPQLIKDLKDITDINANTSVSYAIDKYGKVYSWGSNYSKQLCHDDEEADYWVPEKISSKQVDIRDVYSVSVGGQHTLFIMSEEKDKKD